MNLNTALNWVSTILVLGGAGAIALLPELAKSSIFPFASCIIGQIIGIYCARQSRDYPNLGKCVGFILLDTCGVFIRLTN